ncbi:MAG: DUF4403 family protein [Leadbetterella sp.]
MSLPIDFSVDDIEKSLSKSLPVILVDDISFEDNNRDDMKMKVSRKGNLVFNSVQNDILTYEVPLKIWVQKRISALGMEQTPTTEFEVKFRFSTKFAIKNDYNIQTTTTPLGFDWIVKPVLKTGLIDIPISSIVGKVIDSKMAKYGTDIDKVIGESIPLRTLVLDAWNTAMVPYKVSDEYNTWVKITPQEIMAVPFSSSNRMIKTTLGFKILVETLVGTPSVNVKRVTTIPSLKYVPKIPTDFELELFTIVDFKTASDITKKIFVGQMYEFKEGKYKIEILDIEISGENEYLIFKTKTKGSFKGDIYVKGIPVYVPEKKMIMLTKSELDVKTKNFLHKSAAWLLEGYMERKIESDFGMPLQEIMDYSKASTLQSINKEFKKGVSMKGEILDIVPKSVKVDSAGIYATINTKAKVELHITGF